MARKVAQMWETKKVNRILVGKLLGKVHLEE
jgi:hypothetical protein